MLADEQDQKARTGYKATAEDEGEAAGGLYKLISRKNKFGRAGEAWEQDARRDHILEVYWKRRQNGQTWY